MLALIAGTGFYDWEELKNQQEKHISTPYGEASVFQGEVMTPQGSKPLVFFAASCAQSQHTSASD